MVCRCHLISCHVEVFHSCKWLASLSNFCACIWGLLIDLEVDHWWWYMELNYLNSRYFAMVWVLHQQNFNTNWELKTSNHSIQLCFWNRVKWFIGLKASLQQWQWWIHHLIEEEERWGQMRWWFQWIKRWTLWIKVIRALNITLKSFVIPFL